MVILNEREYAERILRTGEVGKKPAYTVNLLVKYFYHCEGITNSEQIENKVNEFMCKHCPSYNAVRWSNIVEGYIRQAPKRPIHEINNINIYESELEIIQELEDEKDRRILFCMLCYAKYNNAIRPEINNNWCNVEIEEVYKSARVTVRKTNDRMFRLGALSRFINNEEDKNPLNPNKELRLIKSKRIDKINFQIPFVVQEPTNETPAMTINDFRELGYEYLMYYAEGNFTRCQCEDCGILFRQNKLGTKKYCNEHKGYQPIGYVKKVCECCGKEFEIPAQNTLQKFCNECSEERIYYEKIETKIIKCVDCGKEFEIDSKATKQERCPECYKIHRREKEKERMRLRRLKEKQEKK